MKRQLKLSQCMIVKNEEKNIRKALSWGKGLVYEQIVVDTGSTDRTVEIAEEMGAKVFRFQWENDFSAAKNYALEQASGNWIAFLDADEYFREEDVPELKRILTNLAERPEYREIALVRCTMLHLDDEGKPFSSMQQDRIYRNLPQLRYQNRIHESLYHKNRKTLVRADLGMDIPIFHTGYADQAMKGKNKQDRNLEILREELEADPENYNNWSYLGDALLLGEDRTEAKRAFYRALGGPEGSIHPDLALNSISNLIRYSMEDPEFTREKWETLYRKYEELHREHPDIEYWSGLYHYVNGRWQEAAEHLEKTFSILERVSTSFTLYVTGILEKAYDLLANACLKLEKKPEAVKNFSLSLKVKSDQPEVLSSLLGLFRKAGEPEQGVAGFLSRLYDLTNLKDKLFLIREAKMVEWLELEDALKTYLTAEEAEWLESEHAEEETGAAELPEEYAGILCRNQTDIYFLRLVRRLETMGAQEILDDMKLTLNRWQIQRPELSEKLKQFYQDNPYWGELKPEEAVYTALGNRISLWKEQTEDFLWLYGNLADYRSKRVLTAILENWYFLKTEGLEQVKEAAYSCYDPDILCLEKTGDVLDLKAGKGDYIQLMEQQLGNEYETLICCEDRPLLQKQLKKRLQNKKGHPVRIFETLQPAEGDLANVGFMRVNAEAGTYRAIIGLEPVIEGNRPQVMAAVYYSYEDLIRIPRRLKEICPEYRLYLRYFGEDLIPTDYMLYAVKKGDTE